MKRLWELLEVEHGGCDQNTCDIAVAMRLGHVCWAATVFRNSGAASNEFIQVFDRQGKRFHAIAEKERKELCREPHVYCPHCNAVLWLPDECDYWCDSCAKQIPRKGAL